MNCALPLPSKSSPFPAERSAAETSSDRPVNPAATASASIGKAKVECIDPVADSRWDSEVMEHPEAAFFHRSAWAKVLTKTYGHRPFYLRCSMDGKTTALVPLMEISSALTGRRGVCLPFTDFCGPLVFDSTKAPDLGKILAELAVERKWKHFELRGGQGCLADATPAVAFHGHALDLRGGGETLFDEMLGAVRRAVRKAERSDLQVRFSQEREAMREFYRLHVRTRRKHGVPPQPESFFENIHSEVIRAGLGFIALAEVKSRPAAAAIFFHSGKRAVYKFGASDEGMQDIRPSNLVMWRGIQRLAESGVEELHFGRTSLGNGGLRRFKLGWGTRETSMEYFRFQTKSAAWGAAEDRASGLHNLIFRRLPIRLNRVAGAILYPHLD